MKTVFKNLFIFFFFVSINSFTQTHISGTVIDQNTKQPLPFVNIVYHNSKHLGTTTDLDGRFTIHSNQNISDLEFSFMGYQTKKLKTTDLETLKNLKVKLKAQAYILQEAKVFGIENPAHRIIKKAVKNRKQNDPTHLKTFKYNTYNKMFFSFDFLYYQKDDTLNALEYALQDTSKVIDSTMLKLNQFQENQYLFLMESVTEKKFKKPGKVHEKVVASRVSGFKNPMFTLLGSELQSFSIYSDYISVFGVNYLSPLAKNSHSKYLFIIQDTLVNHKADTTYTLSYKPRKNRNFKGLEGILQINTNGYAVENFSIKPIKQGIYSVIVRQKYVFEQDSAWFPKQLDADIIFSLLGDSSSASLSMANDSTYSGPNNATLYGKAKTYIKNIELNPPIKNREFSYIALEYNQEANNKDSLFWSEFREDTISEKEMNTYRVIDSLGDELDFERMLNYLTYLMKGEIPFGPVSLDLNSLMYYNQGQGLRLGVGLLTNDKACKHVSIGAYGAYGFGDKAWKYGSHLKINLRDHYDSHILLKYQNDISELGSFSFLETNALLSQESFRNLLINSLMYEQSGEIAIEARYLYYLKTRLSAKFSRFEDRFQSYDISENQRFNTPIDIPEVSLKLRYAYQERYISTPIGIQPIKSKYPVLFFNISKSLAFDTYALDYTRIWAKIEKDFTIRNVGISSVSLQSGYAYGDLPYFKLFNGHGSYYPFTILALNSFGTMRLNEFNSDRFVYLFYRHSFGNLLFKSKYMEPEFSLVHNMGWSDMKNKNISNFPNNQSMSKGYFESGLVIDNIFKINQLQYGLGVYYRYGPYAFKKQIDNFGFKFSFKYSIPSL